MTEKENVEPVAEVTGELLAPFLDKNRKGGDRTTDRATERGSDRRATGGSQKTGKKRRRGDG